MWQRLLVVVHAADSTMQPTISIWLTEWQGTPV
jgi:hypothetical protein